jgi:hypothetical protein
MNPQTRKSPPAVLVVFVFFVVFLFLFGFRRAFGTAESSDFWQTIPKLQARCGSLSLRGSMFRSAWFAVLVFFSVSATLLARRNPHNSDRQLQRSRNVAGFCRLALRGFLFRSTRFVCCCALIRSWLWIILFLCLLLGSAALPARRNPQALGRQCPSSNRIAFPCAGAVHVSATS